MKLETVKTIILTALVITSIVLTYGIWTYHPNYELMGHTSVVPEVLISDQKEMKQIIRPTKVFHHFDETHYGTKHPAEIDSVIKEMSRWDFTKFNVYANNQSNVKQYLHRRNTTEVIFPENIPMSIYKNILGIKNDELDFIFDRIIIDYNNIYGDTGTVYFIHAEKEYVVEAKVSASFVKGFEEKFYYQSIQNSLFSEYALEKITENNSILVRKKPVQTFAYNYLIESIPSYKFRDALFRNPSFVKGNATASGAEYKDSSSLLSVHFDTNMILYVNPVQDYYGKMEAHSLLQKSIDFVNSHGGWTNQYIYVEIDEQEKTSLFRMYTNAGFPIFNYNGMSEILLIWGQTGIYQYSRNNFSIERLVESTKIVLSSGVDVVKKLQKQSNIEPEFIQDIMIGYEMTKFTGDPLIHLEPAWYYKYKDQWIKVPTDIEGGIDYGLE